jgi:class 3 adenylate cyclase
MKANTYSLNMTVMLSRFFSLNIRLQLALIVSASTVVAAVAFYLYVSDLQRSIFVKSFTQATSASLEMMRLSIEAGFANDNLDIVQGVLRRAKQDPLIDFIVITDTADAVIAQYPDSLPMTMQRIQTLSRSRRQSIDDSVIVQSGVWKAERATYTIAGRVIAGFSTAELHLLEKETAEKIGLTALLSLIGGIGVAYLIAFGITRPLERLRGIALQIASGETTLRADERSGGEDVRSLARAFNQMLAQLMASNRRIAEQNLQLEREQQKNEELLLNILPTSIAERLKRGETMIADSHSDVTVVFADIVGFTELAAQYTPSELIDILNRVFSLLDEFSQFYGVEKIKTIGDAYMLVSGAPNPNPLHAEHAALMALEIVEAVYLLSQTLGVDIKVRVGMHSGAVVAGVIGTRKFAYDLWGDTVNVASRMESHGAVGKVQCSETVYQRLKEHFHFEERGVISIKGKGEMSTYFLVGRKSEELSTLWKSLVQSS